MLLAVRRQSGSEHERLVCDGGQGNPAVILTSPLVATVSPRRASPTASDVIGRLFTSVVFLRRGRGSPLIKLDAGRFRGAVTIERDGRVPLEHANSHDNAGGTITLTSSSQIASVSERFSAGQR